MTYPPNNDPYANQQPPQQPYGAPPPQYGAPQQPYGQPQYGAPAGYGAPAVNYAHWGLRVGAFLVDEVCVLPFYLIAITLGNGDNGLNAFYFIFMLLALVVQGYNRWYQAGKTGQSWGKKALGIRLVREDSGQPIGAGLAFGRDFLHIVDGLPCYIGYLWPLWDQKKQTFSDKIVKTIVVK
ncbi:RDD family protein [Paractinoplanes durhamensis]|uniref:RDD domain-containing protein n=1 Tax=Paractinoplanes durhamensis TaxID=113563 RepID=A0ABQ3Z845_9ACTN|nr:RDD family protein [Actinoplanes durhamensis]GIE06003.1 hypothetical protein Adu01nite_73530 [Actinoplanes durhamensis]